MYGLIMLSSRTGKNQTDTGRTQNTGYSGRKGRHAGWDTAHRAVWGAGDASCV